VLLGSIAEKPGSTPESLAAQLGIDIDEILRLLGDLDAAGMVTPRSG
jgi:DNA-binding MarR family transcriptional regulator